MRLRLSRTLALRAAMVIAVGAAGAFVAARASSGSAPAGVSTDSSSWRLPRLGGAGDLSLADLRGHPVVVDFFASWCTACQGELPGMAAVAQRVAGRVSFAGVDTLETGDGLAMARRYGIGSWPLAADGGDRGSGLHDALGAPGMPVTAFYDAGGRLVLVVSGAISEDDLLARLHTLFGVTT